MAGKHRIDIEPTETKSELSDVRGSREHPFNTIISFHYCSMHCIRNAIIRWRRIRRKTLWTCWRWWQWQWQWRWRSRWLPGRRWNDEWNKQTENQRGEDKKSIFFVVVVVVLLLINRNILCRGGVATFFSQLEMFSMSLNVFESIRSVSRSFSILLQFFSFFRFFFFFWIFYVKIEKYH